jgi:hypothetical protein
MSRYAYPQRIVVFQVTPEQLQAVREKIPGRWLGKARKLPLVLRVFIDELLKDGTVVQVNDTSNVKKAQWLTLSPDGERLILFWLASKQEIRWIFISPMNKEFFGNGHPASVNFSQN